MKKVLASARHRNGVSGTPFFVAVFIDKDGIRKVGIRLDAKLDTKPTAVLDLDKLNAGNVAFSDNSFRGDMFDADMQLAEKRMDRARR